MKKRQAEKSVVAQRVEVVRNAVADASKGLTNEQYTELFETLISDADGWRADLEDRQAEAEE